MKPKLDKDEQDFLDSIEKGEWKPLKNSDEEKAKYQIYAKEFFAKDQRINIRISSKDLDLLKMKAMHEGIPYQTLISSILHKYVNGY